MIHDYLNKYLPIYFFFSFQEKLWWNKQKNNKKTIHKNWRKKKFHWTKEIFQLISLPIWMFSNVLDLAKWYTKLSILFFLFHLWWKYFAINLTREEMRKKKIFKQMFAFYIIRYFYCGSSHSHRFFSWFIIVDNMDHQNIKITSRGFFFFSLFCFVCQ